MSQNKIEAHEGGGMSFVGPKAVNTYRATVVASALRLYARTGMKANRAYTPANMMRVAQEIIGQKFKARDYLGAADALKAWATAQALLINVANAAEES